jgi:G3E family GTPase
VVVNDMADVNIDVELVKRGAGEVAREKEELLSLTNGCICCTLREDLLRTLLTLAAKREVDYIVVEGSGISEPLPVAETFTFVEPLTQRSLSQYAMLDTMVTVVDGPQFMSDFRSEDLLATRGMEATPEDQRSLSHLLADQIDFSNVILLNKIDLLSPEERSSLSTLLKTMNPAARVYETSHSQLPLSAILNTGLFSMKAAADHPNWLVEARIGDHKPETLESVTVCARVCTYIYICLCMCVCIC